MKGLILLLLITFISVKQNSIPSNKIIWSKDYLLQWTDFSGSPENITGTDAYTFSEINYTLSEDKVAVTCAFRKDKSLSLKSKQSIKLLQHEQYHFNLSEVYARLFRKSISESGKDNLEQKIKASLIELNKAQKKYDTETNHSRDTVQQAKWIKIIDGQLAELSKYSY